MTRRNLLAVLAGLATVGLTARPAPAMSFDRDQIRCATCNYWEGTRKAHAETRVDVEVFERGRCGNMDSPYRNLWVGILNSCPQYIIWDRLSS